MLSTVEPRVAVFDVFTWVNCKGDYICSTVITSNFDSDQNFAIISFFDTNFPTLSYPLSLQV